MGVSVLRSERCVDTAVCARAHSRATQGKVRSNSTVFTRVRVALEYETHPNLCVECLLKQWGSRIHAHITPPPPKFWF